MSAVVIEEPTRRTSWTAPELMSAEFPEPRWAVPCIVPEGLTLLAGAPKLGKSWLAMALAVAVSTGGKALGRLDVEQGEALYLALEDPARRLQQRLGIVLEGDAVPPSLHFATAWPLFHDGGADQLAAWLEVHPDCRLVVVDVLARIRGSLSDKEDRYTADYRVMTRLKNLADEYCVAIVVVHHTRKASAEDFLDLVSGTQGLAGACDTVLVLARSRGTADAKLHVTGRDVEEAEHALNLTNGCWTLLAGPASDYETSQQRRAILEAVRAEEGIGPKAIAEASGVKHDVVKHLVRKMVDDNQLDTDGNGHYLIAGGV